MQRFMLVAYQQRSRSPLTTNHLVPFTGRVPVPQQVWEAPCQCGESDGGSTSVAKENTLVKYPVAEARGFNSWFSPAFQGFDRAAPGGRFPPSEWILAVRVKTGSVFDPLF